MRDASDNRVKQRIQRERDFPETAAEVYSILQKERKIGHMLPIYLVKRMLKNDKHQEVAWNFYGCVKYV